MEYRFKTGPFAGKSMEHVFLRYATELYRKARWAKREQRPQLAALVAEFERLRRKLRNAPIVTRCAKSGCKHEPNRMTLPLGYDHYYWPDPDFWCRKHGPSEEDERNSGKMEITFDAIDSFREEKNRVAVHRSVLIGLGIKRRHLITEKYAHEFFASLH
jgi:hypothetical protein